MFEIIPPFNGRITPVRQLTYERTFTVSDQIERIRLWANESLLEHLNTELEKYGNESEALIAAFNAVVQDVVNSSVELQDEVLAQLIGFDSDARSAMTALFPVIREWDGVEYPERVEGAWNWFVNGPNPGLLADPSDSWMPTIQVVIDTVATQISTANSNLFKAVQSANHVPVPIQLMSPTLPIVLLGDYPSRSVGYQMADAVNAPIQGIAVVPNGWSKASVRSLWSHASATPGNVRFITTVSVESNEQFIEVPSHTFTATPKAPYVKASFTHAPSFDVTPGDIVNYRAMRQGTSGADTHAEDIVFHGSYLVRIA